jgi:hypothetical protein
MHILFVSNRRRTKGLDWKREVCRFVGVWCPLVGASIFKMLEEFCRRTKSFWIEEIAALDRNTTTFSHERIERVDSGDRLKEVGCE